MMSAIGKPQKILWLNSLRALGLLLVLSYHLLPASAGVLQGGFVGVDIFFVLSGYLTTALAIRKLSSFSLSDFFARRIRRLFPPLVVMVVVVVPLLLLISVDFRSGLLHQLTAVLGQGTNYYEIVHNGSYANTFLPHLFTHTWTLAVEVHYYIIWALLLFLLSKVISNPRALRVVLVVVALAAAVGSALLMFQTAEGLTASEDFTPAYLATQTHLFPLMIGSAIGAAFPLPSASARFHLPRKFAIAAAAVLVVGIVTLAQILRFNNIQTYSFGLFTVSALVGALVIAILSLNEGHEPRFATYLSDRSYSVYLFHWPLLVILTAFLHEKFALSSPWLVAVVVIILSFGLAELTYRFVEKPLASKPARVTKRAAVRKLLTLVVVVVLGIVTAFVAVTAPAKTTIEQQLDAQSRLSAVDALADFGSGNAKPVLDNSHPELWTQKPSVRQAKAEEAKRKAEQDKAMAEQYAPITNAPATVIGDSVTNMASKTLRDTIPGVYVDAEGFRKMCQGLDVVNDLKGKNALSHTIVIALGENILAPDHQCATDIITTIGPAHQVIFVTGYGVDCCRPMADFADEMRGLAKQYENVTIADWARAIDPRAHEPGMMSADHFHPASEEAKQIYADTIKDAIEKVKNL